MLPSVNDAQGWIVLLLGLAALALQVWALVDCALTRADAFVAADKRTKPLWLLVTGLAVLVGLTVWSGADQVGRAMIEAGWACALVVVARIVAVAGAGEALV